MIQYTFKALGRRRKAFLNRTEPTEIQAARKPHLRGLTFETLEDRRLLATWDGGVSATGDLWHDPVNWVGDVLPAVGEDVVIGSVFSDTTIRTNQSVAIGALDSAASLTIESGVFAVAEASTVSGAFVLAAGELAGAGDLTLTGSASWSSGSMTGSGKTIVDMGATLEISSLSLKYLVRSLENRGSITYDGANLLLGLSVGTSGLIDNLPSGVFTAIGESDVTYNHNNVLHTFRNQGTFRHAGDGTTQFWVKFENVGGTIQIDSGDVSFQAGGSLSGAATFFGNPVLTGGTMTVAQDAAVSGDALRVVLGGTLEIVGNAALERLHLDQGAVTGAGDLTITDEAIWYAGPMSGDGRTIVNAGAILEISSGSNKHSERTLENRGIVIYEGANFFVGSPIENLPAGLFSIVGESDISYSNSNGSRLFHNQGTLRHTGVGKSTISGVELDNAGGTIQVDAGDLWVFTGSDAELAGESRLSIAAGASLELPGGIIGDTTNAAGFYPLGGLVLHGGPNPAEPRLLEALSTNRGAVPAGWSQNFAYRQLDLAGGNMRLVDDADNAFGGGPEALYVESLIVRQGANLDLNGLPVYVASLQIQGSVIGGSVTEVPFARITGPQVSFATAAETVAEDAGTIVVEVSLLAPADESLSVPIEIIAAATTATSSADYVLLTTEATFSAGQLTTTVEIEIVDDDDAEVGEIVTLRLMPIDGVDTGSIATFQLTLLDNDTPPGASLVGFYQRVNEGDSATVEVRLDAVAAEDVTIPLIVSGTATVDDDFLLPATSIVIPAGSQRGSVDVSIVDDDDPEQVEWIRVEMGQPVNAVVSTRPGTVRQHTINISANDAPTISFSSATQIKIEDAGLVDVELTLSEAATYEIIATFAVHSTATPDEFSINLPYRVTFPIGATTATIPVTLIDDEVRESGADRVVLSLNTRQLSGVLPGRLTQHTLYVIDNEPRLVSFKEVGQSVWEDAGDVTVEISLDGTRGEDTKFHVIVTGATPYGNYALRNQPPRPGVLNPNDFSIGHADVAAGQPVVIPAGQRTVTIPIHINDDSYNERSERIVLKLDDRAFTTQLGLPSNLGGQKTHTIVIKDNDPLITIAAPNGGTVREGNPPYPLPVLPGAPLVLEMTLSAATNRNIVVPVPSFVQLGGRTITFGTAQFGIDYVLQSAAILVTAGQTKSGTLVGFVLTDSLDESNETVVFKFGAPIGGGILKSPGTAITIIDDDGSPFAYYATADTSFRESKRLGLGISTASLQEVKVKLNTRSAQDLFVKFSFSGTAKLGSDYSLVGLDSQKRLKFPAGKREASFLIKTINDSTTESTETIIVEMTSGSTASFSTKLADKRRTFRILDDDAPASSPAAPSGTIHIGVEPIDGLPDSDPSDLPAIDSSNDPTVGVGIVALSGALENTTLFFDANFNGLPDYLDLNDNGIQELDESDEPAVVSGLEGLLSIDLPRQFDRNNDGFITADEGRWGVVGGVDASTNLPWRVPMYAPVGFYVVSPLSTLVESLVRTQGQAADDAETRVLEAFGMEGAAIASSHLPQSVANGDGQAAVAYAQLVQLSDTVLAIADLFAGAPAGLPLELFADQTYEAIAERIAGSGWSIDLTEHETIGDLITGVRLSTGVTLHVDPVVEDSIIEAAAAILSAGNLAIGSLVPTGDLSYLEAVTRVKQVMHGALAPALHDVTAGAADLATVLDQFTGANLENRIAAATLGSLARPAIHVLDAEMVEGNLGQSLLEFTVELVGVHEAPVSVDYITADGLATEADNDYLSATGSLSWPAGDNSPRTIQVEISGDSTFEYDEDLAVLLQNPTNAFFTRQVAMGVVRNDDALSHSLPSSGPNWAQLELDASVVGLLVGGAEVVGGAIANPLQVELLGQDGAADRLSIDASSAGRHDSVAFHAGGGLEVDALALTGGSYDSVKQTFAGATAGATTLRLADGVTELSVAWDGVETTALHYGGAAGLTLVFGGEVTAVVVEDADPADADPALAGKMRVVSPTGQFAPTTFGSEVGSVIVRGYFDEANLTISSLDPTFDAEIVFISLLPTQGDYNGDRQVDGADLLVWRNSFGNTGTDSPLPGDGDEDQDVDGADFLIWQRHVNQALTGSVIETAFAAMPAAAEPVVMPPAEAAFALAEFDLAVTTDYSDFAPMPIRVAMSLSAVEARDEVFTDTPLVGASPDQAIARHALRPAVDDSIKSGREHKSTARETLRWFALRDEILAAWETLRSLADGEE